MPMNRLMLQRAIPRQQYTPDRRGKAQGKRAEREAPQQKTAKNEARDAQGAPVQAGSHSGIGKGNTPVIVIGRQYSQRSWPDFTDSACAG
jgi:hypothetical protein